MQNRANENSTWVYIWRTSLQGVGHASIQVGGAYVSLHPGIIPAFGPTALMPLPADCASTLTEDMIIEGASRNKNGMSDNPARIAPDRVFKIDGLDQKQMRSRVDEVKAGAKTGQINYQLFPNVSLLKLVAESSVFVSHDPVDIALWQRNKLMHPSVDDLNLATNCTGLVSDILARGGMRIGQSKMPWGLTPNRLEQEIAKEQDRLLKK